MNKTVILGGLAAISIVLVASASASKKTGKNPIERVQGLPTGGYKNVKEYYQTVRSQVGWGDTAQLLPTKNAEFTWNMQKKEFERRNREATAYALAHPELTGVGNDGIHGKFGAAPDKFSKQSFLVYRPGNDGYKVIDGRKLATMQSGPTAWGWYLTDEFGRPYEGWGYGDNPFKTVLAIAQMALPLIPGLGTAAAASLAAAIALGQGKSLKDAALAAARAGLPPGAQLAFDAGVGVASGQPLDQVAINALEKQYPGARLAYEKGKAMVKS